MKRLIKRILREHKSDKYYKFLDRVSTMVRPPYFKSMEDFTIDEQGDQKYIMKKVLGGDIRIDGRRDDIYDDDGNKIYKDYHGYWWIYNYRGNQIYQEHSDGDWRKFEYDDNGNLIYQEHSDGHWRKYEYNEYGTEIYFENSYGTIWDNR